MASRRKASIKPAPVSGIARPPKDDRLSRHRQPWRHRMATLLTLRDETSAGDHRTAVTLSLPEPTITARELIRSRVFEEVKTYNEKLAEWFDGLVQPEGSEPERGRV